jgi:phosphatidate phosphatase LPIN
LANQKTDKKNGKVDGTDSLKSTKANNSVNSPTIKTEGKSVLPSPISKGDQNLQKSADRASSISHVQKSWISSFLSYFVRTDPNSQLSVQDESVVKVFRPTLTADSLVQVTIMVKQSGNCDLLLDIIGNEDSLAVGVSSVSNELLSESKQNLFSNTNNVQSSFIEMSLCGKYLQTDSLANNAIFKKYLVAYETICENPALVYNQDLIIRYQNLYYPGHVALPLLLSSMAFGKPLNESSLLKLAQHASYKHLSQTPNPADLNSKDKRANSGLFGWFSRKRSSTHDRKDSKDSSETASPTGGINIPSPKNESSNKQIPEQKKADVSVDISDEVIETDLSSLVNYDSADDSRPSNRLKYRKTLIPSSEMLDLLDLKEGSNIISFSVHSSLVGVQTVNAFIYLWNYSSKLVISDVDGTITKSDFLGNLMPLVGKDWSHNGVTPLFSNISKNGYKMVYLTSRSIGQANVTREFLYSIRQGDIALPQGPIIMSPDGLINSFKREVIDRRPQDFKIPALQQVYDTFPDDYNPFFAGFGNRDTDLEAYKTVGVPVSKIFIINPKGEIQHMNRALRKTYISLNDLVHEMFPPLNPSGSVAEYSEFMYWKDPITPIPTSPTRESETELETDHDPLEDPLG